MQTEKDEFLPYVYNTDQSGMQPEMHTGRTLAFNGSEQVAAKVQSTFSIAHSYTIQPKVRIDGTLYPILFICLEASKRFPQNPREPIANCDNIYFKCFASGKLGKELIKDWF